MATTRRSLVGGRRILVLALFGLAGLAACQGAGQGTAEADAGVRVAVSVAPQADLVRRLGGPRVEATVLVPPGSEPHAWEPSPRVVASLADADLYFAIGHPGFPFETRLIASLGAERRDGLPVVTLSGEGLDGSRSTGDPHLWLSPRRVREAMVRLADELGRIDPDHAEGYQRHLEALLSEIDAADRRLAAAAAAVPGRTFLTYHAAWGAVAEDYGLEQVAVEHSGREPGPRQMARVIDRARSENLTLVLVERGVSHRSAETLAEEIGGRLVEVDPLGDDWTEIMDQLIDAFEGSAEGSAPP